MVKRMTNDLRYGDERSPQILHRSIQAVLGVGIAVGLIWLATGFYMVGPGEQGVIRQFGKEIASTGPGLHYHWPWPIQQVNVVNMERIRRAEIGFRTVHRLDQTFTQRVLEEAQMLTGDANIVDVQMIVQYRIKDASKYLFRLRDPDENLRAAAEVALRSAVGNMTIDEVLTVGRAKIQEDTHTLLQQLMDDYQSGIQVTEVRLQVVDPPDQVEDAFHEVVRAREDLERLINQARGYREDVLPKARGEAERIRRAAEGYKAERVLKAQGEADRFLALLAEYQKAPQVTRDRLYLETMARILPKVGKMVIADRQGLVPLLSLPEMGGTSPAISTTPPETWQHLKTERSQ